MLLIDCMGSFGCII